MRAAPLACLLFGCASTAPPPSAPSSLPSVATAAPATAPVAPPPRTTASGEVIDLRTVDTAMDVGAAMATDARGRTFVVGSVSSGDSDAYVLALDAERKTLWSKRIGGRGADYGDDVAVDATGVYVSGAFESPSIDLGAGPLKNAGIHDLFLAKYDFDGKLLWAKRYGDALDQISMRLRAHPDGGVVATGWFIGTLDFGAGPVHGVSTKASFVARIDASGHGIWSRAFGHRYDYAETDAAIDARGHVFVSGGSEGTSEFVHGGGPAAHDDLAPVLLELDEHGKIVSAKRFGGGGDNVTTALALAPDGSLRFAASSRGTLDFGDGPRRPSGYEEAVDVASFDASGAFAWRTRTFSDRLASVSALAVNARGESVVVGEILRHEREPAPYGHDAERGIAVALSASGSILWTYVLGGGAHSSLERVAFDSRGRVVLAGTRGHALVFVTLSP